ncbi:hypothetical protein JJB07_12010 [Tumebacillus sp. ITR2]|uniref:Uncharacterized protein n=1 Tax=Tumebacillus amylolyticus TaxID=2801339 RepID=A0ABS1JAR8_9BACL|nr:hypothetical protein [Tumebacillus amylolyticus]MBL0387378.1 hypothetical protein [Tumebacillus amylolyticus]
MLHEEPDEHSEQERYSDLNSPNVDESEYKLNKQKTEYPKRFLTDPIGCSEKYLSV